MRNDFFFLNATTGQKWSRRTNALIWDELGTTMSPTLEFLATKAKLEQGNSMQWTLL